MMAQFMRAHAQLLQRTPGLPEFDGLVEIATPATSWQYILVMRRTVPYVRIWCEEIRCGRYGSLASCYTNRFVKLSL